MLRLVCSEMELCSVRDINTAQQSRTYVLIYAKAELQALGC